MFSSLGGSRIWVRLLCADLKWARRKETQFSIHSDNLELAHLHTCSAVALKSGATLFPVLVYDIDQKKKKKNW